MNRVSRFKGPTPTVDIGPVRGADRKPAEKAAAGFGVTHGLHRQSPPAHPHTGMKVATIQAPMPGLRIDFGENDRMDRGSNPSRSSLSFGRSFDPSWGSSWSSHHTIWTLHHHWVGSVWSLLDDSSWASWGWDHVWHARVAHLLNAHLTVHHCWSSLDHVLLTVYSDDSLSVLSFELSSSYILPLSESDEDRLSVDDFSIHHFLYC